MQNMKFRDAKIPLDTIEATVRQETHGDLIEIEIHRECIYLTKENAKAFGLYLMQLSETI